MPGAGSQPSEGCRRWVPAVRGVLGAGSQPSEGCWAPGLRATPSPRSSGCRTSECSRTGCWALGPSRQRGAGCRVPAVRGVLGTGASHPCTPEAPGCLPTLTFPPPPTQPFLLLPGGNAKRRRRFSGTSSALCLEARVPGLGPDIHRGLDVSCVLGA